ncbi:hypothetical protein [Nocardioides sp.]|uniref:hypothetical protein n=1 Tax=Nocardioides sp. TaxID=35761 RepID=UPI000C8C4C41|nr:hypothetical protein [Nocardioides sp.]MAS55820.1 hypothetical protein [Pimelobacter sp.]MDE0776677.1 hypothetical protein [Nocardioides sp.]
MTQDGDLGPAPEPQIEPGEPNPGGVDAISFPDGAEAIVEDGGEPPAPVMRDLDPDANPAVEESLPDEMKQGEDTTTEATKGKADEVDPDEESPA